MKTAVLIIGGIMQLAPSPAFAQCSDAGVCSIGHEAERSAHSLSISYGFGKSTSADDLMFHSVSLEAGIGVLEGTRLLIGIPFNSQSGPLGSTSGIGDLTIAVNQYVLEDDVVTVAIQCGVRLATGKVTAGGLPQSYQSGLGTNDLLAGMTISSDSWNAAIGYQLSRGRSANSATRLKRGDDLLVRAGTVAEVEGLQLRGDVLAIKRLQVSSGVDPISSFTDSYRDIPNSDQFQINLQGQAGIPLEDGFDAVLTAALPLLKREVNVDGLTRSISLSAGLAIRF